MSKKYENIEFSRVGNELGLTIDLDKVLRISGTGKSVIIAETKGQAGIKLMAKEGGELCRIKVLVYKPVAAEVAEEEGAL